MSGVEVLLTGASGFVGSLLLPRLLGQGHEVAALTRNPSALRASLAGEERPLPRILAGDAVTGDGLEDALEGSKGRAVPFWLTRPPDVPRTIA